MSNQHKQSKFYSKQKYQTQQNKGKGQKKEEERNLNKEDNKSVNDEDNNDTNDKDKKESDLSNGEKLQEYYKKYDKMNEQILKAKFKVIQLEPIETVEYRIRMRGTFTLALVNLTQNLNDQKNRFYIHSNKTIDFNPFDMNKRLHQIHQKRTNTYKKQQMKNNNKIRQQKSIKNKRLKKDQIMVNGKPYEKEDIMKLNLFLYDKIELPLNCKFQLSKAEQVILGQQGEKLKKCWKENSESESSSYIDLPYLNSEQFSQFYQCSIQTMGITSQPDDYTTSEQARWRHQEVLAMVLYSNWNRSTISWLEYWVYACAKGQFVPPYQYMYLQDLTEQDKANIQVIKDIIIKQQLKLASRNSQAPLNKQQYTYTRGTYVGARFNKQHQLSNKYYIDLLQYSKNQQTK